MNKQIEVLKLALEALGWTDEWRPQGLREEAISAIKAALAQDEQSSSQEPVAWLHWLHGPVHVFLNKNEAMMELDRLNRDYPVDKNARQMKSLYTTPPKRPWVGLTDEEASWCQAPSTIQTWKRIEAKLKELNT